jgi:transposase
VAAKGEHQQAIGRSRGGRITKIHALTDADYRPVAFLLSGNSRLHRWSGSARRDTTFRDPARRQGYDSDAIRRQVEGNGAMPNISRKANRHWKNCLLPVFYRSRNAIERMFCRLKDFRRIATIHDRLAINFLAAVCIAAIDQLPVMSPDP